tara:strand:- start:2873 stop:3133 length:261 start_codon:yes stop_codon:yes gene_type:complete
MCMGGGRPPAPPPPPPLPPPPPPPLPPKAPLPDPEPIETDINPKVQRSRSTKAANPQSKGTQALRIPMKQVVNTGPSQGTSGGINV